MLSRRFFIILLMSLTVLPACAPKKNSKTQIRPGRTRNSPTGASVNGTPTSLSSGNANTVWAGVTGNVAGFDQAVYTLAQTSLDGASADDQLGSVSPQPGNAGGIFFWGSVKTTPQGQIDGNNSRIHIEIFDSKYGSIGANGQTISQLFLHIGPEQQGFINVQAYSQNELIFASEAFSIKLEGNIQANPYTGIMYFANAYNNYQWQALGQFSVPRSGFFNF